MVQPIELGDPAVEPDGFRRALGEFATGVTVITTKVDGAEHGMTSNSFSSVSLEPPLILWSIRRASRSFGAFEACSHFAVNVLASDQMELSQRFARSGPDKFEGVDWKPGKAGVPLLNDVAASFECQLGEVHDGGDHLILIGMVERYCRYDRPPLLFAKGRYAIAADHPDTNLLGATESNATEPVHDEHLLSLLMVRAYNAIAARLEQGRQSAGLGLTLMQARVLKAVHTRPGSTHEGLLPELFLDFNASRHVLESMVNLGLLAVDLDGRIHLTVEGERRIFAIMEHTRDSERMLLQGISEDEFATVQRVLSKIVSEHA